MAKKWRKTKWVLLLFALFTALGLCSGAAGLKAQLNNMPVLVQDEAIAVEAYNINDYNYFKLRDIAEALKSTSKSFEIQYNNTTNAIYISTGQAYTSLGTELSPPQGTNTIKQAVNSRAALYIDGVGVELSAYNIDDYTYYKLQDLGQALDFRVEYDNDNRRVLIESTPLDTDQPEQPTTPEQPEEPEEPEEPKEPGDLVIMVDPGHGGTDTGTINEEQGLTESLVNYDVAMQLGDMLEQAGYTVIYTREGRDETISLTDRMNLIRQVRPDLVISVHHNATTNHNASGAEVLAQVADKEGGPSTELAELINAEYEKIGQKVRPIVYRLNSSQTADYYGLLRAAAGVDVTAVISEFAFLDNPEDWVKIDSPEDLQAEAEALFRAVDTFLRNTYSIA
mgnify:FL=1